MNLLERAKNFIFSVFIGVFSSSFTHFAVTELRIDRVLILWRIQLLVSLRVIGLNVIIIWVEILRLLQVFLFVITILKIIFLVLTFLSTFFLPTNKNVSPNFFIAAWTFDQLYSFLFLNHLIQVSLQLHQLLIQLTEFARIINCFHVVLQVIILSFTNKLILLSIQAVIIATGHHFRASLEHLVHDFPRDLVRNGLYKLII